eukprot:TRINITY_DN481_c0_g1_i10.p1 TRINITY_DN481_c0_g1~~TRINITY_DN481_c0_g1_i10.p1  ORF type:complete len:428 (+),score=120.55 TRINITY_DN481_c0_g1_i10:566-1849(+)
MAEDELVYNEVETSVEVSVNLADSTNVKSGYTGVHSSSFKDFLLRAELLQAITQHGFEHPSEVQQSCIPQAILGTNILCQAKSGMGKTAVFVLSTLQRLGDEDFAGSSSAAKGSALILVLAHTRELADQIFREYRRFCTSIPSARPIVIYGGIPIEEQRKQLREESPNIVVGTPGRVEELVSKGDLNLSNVKMFVLDECDQILDRLDMRRTVQNIFVKTPKEKQVMMFTATLNDKSREICKKFMQGALLEILIDDDKLTLDGLVQYYVSLSENQKNKKLLEILDAITFNNCVVFVSKPPRAQALAAILKREGFPVIDIRSDLPQPERLARFNKFKSGEYRIMVSTDLMGRGVDVNRVNLVVNYDMPDKDSTYLHRVGRAGRFNTRGLAISFISSEEDKSVLEKVQSHYVVDIPTMPAHIDSSVYMNS